MNFDDLLETGLKLAETQSGGGNSVQNQFYRLKKTDGNGEAIVRILPDPEGQVVVGVRQISARDAGNRKWCDELSLTNIGEKDPFHETWARLWEAGAKDEARQYKSIKRYIFNVLIVKDPAAPENEGTVQLLNVNEQLYEKIMTLTQGSGIKEPVNLFHPLEPGYDFNLIAKKESSGFTSYSDSCPGKQRAAFKTAAGAEKFIKEKCTPLSLFKTRNDRFYPLSYEELNAKLYDISGGKYGAPLGGEAQEAPKAQEAQEAQPAQEAPKTQPAQKTQPAEDKVAEVDEVDALLAELA